MWMHCEDYINGQTSTDPCIDSHMFLLQPSPILRLIIKIYLKRSNFIIKYKIISFVKKEN